MKIYLIVSRHVISLYLLNILTFRGSFLIRIVFPLFICFGILVSSSCLLSLRASLWWVNVKFFLQNLCMSSWPGVFQFVTFLSIALSDLRCMSTSGLSSSLWNPFSTLFILSAFLSFSFGSNTLLQNWFASFESGFNMSSYILQQLVGRIFFHDFGMFRSYCFTQSQYLLNFPFITIIFYLSLPVVFTVSSLLFFFFF